MIYFIPESFELLSVLFSTPSIDIVPVNIYKPKTNGTTMLWIGLEDITIVRIVKKTGKSDIVSIRILPRLFLQIGLKFPSDRGDFLVEMYILLSLVIFGPYERG